MWEKKITDFATLLVIGEKLKEGAKPKSQSNSGDLFISSESSKYYFSILGEHLSIFQFDKQL